MVGRRIGLDGIDHDSAIDARHVVAQRAVFAERLHANAEPRALHFASRDELMRHFLEHRRRNRKREAAADAVDERIHPDDPAFHVEERAAAVARIDERVGLDVVLVKDRRRARPEQVCAALAADPAGGEAEVLIEWRADRADELADAQRVAVAPFHGGQIARVDADHGDVRLVVGAHYFCGKSAAVLEAHAQLFGVGDDVMVREDEAVRARDEAGAFAAALRHGQLPRARLGAGVGFVAALLAIAEKEIEDVAVAVVVVRGLNGLDDHDRGRHFLKHLDETLVDRLEQAQRGRCFFRLRRAHRPEQGDAGEGDEHFAQHGGN